MYTPTKLPSGNWRIRFTDEHGERRSATYSTYREACHQLSKARIKVQEIKDGLHQAVVRGKTFGDLAAHWRECRVPLKRSGRDDKYILGAYLEPEFGSRLLKDIGQDQGERYKVARLGHLSPGTVRNHINLFNAMWKVGHETLGWVAHPLRIKRPKLATQRFRYLATDEEIHRFLTAAADEGPQIEMLYRLAVYTGMRAGEIAVLLWSDVDLDRRLITVWKSSNGSTKNLGLRHVPIVDPLLEPLRRWRETNPGSRLFTNQNGRMFKSGDRPFQEVLHRVLERGQFPRRAPAGPRSRYITFHDLRHTFASHWMMRGGDRFKLQKILGHGSSEMTDRYSHLAPAAFKDDFGRFGDHDG